MLLKRMRHTTNAAKERLQELHEQHRELEEQMLAVFSEVLDHTIDIPEDEDATLGHSVRHLLHTHGGAEALRERYEQVSAYHHDNYRPLMWGFFRPYRAELFRLSHLLTFRSATHNHTLLDALAFIQRFQHARGDYVPAEIALDFASVRWQALIRTQRRMETVLKRRQLEVCVFYYLDAGLRCGDVYVEGSEAYADYRQQLLPWAECVPRLPAYCQALQFAPTATEFVTALRERLREVARRVDAAYPANTALTIDADGHPASQTAPGATRAGRPRHAGSLSQGPPPRAASPGCAQECAVLGWLYPPFWATLRGRPETRPIQYCAISSPSSAMPVNWGPLKRPAIRQAPLAGTSYDG